MGVQVVRLDGASKQARCYYCPSPHLLFPFLLQLALVYYVLTNYLTHITAMYDQAIWEGSPETEANIEIILYAERGKFCIARPIERC